MTGATMVRVIKVEPLGDGWRVRADQLANDLLFRSGRQAEIAARRLGERLAGAGTPAEIQIHLRDGALAARFACPPRAPATGPAWIPQARSAGALETA